MGWLQLQLPQQKCLLPHAQPHLTREEAQSSLASAIKSLRAGTHARGALWLQTHRSVLAWEMSRGQQKDGADGVKLGTWERERERECWRVWRREDKLKCLLKEFQHHPLLSRRQSQKSRRASSTALSAGCFGLLWLGGSRLDITCLHWRDMPWKKARSRNF